MAKKINPPRQANQVASDELAILHPERTLTVAGRALTVREYGFVEGLAVHRDARALVADLAALVRTQGDAPWDAVLDVLGQHDAVVIELVARACDVEAEWLRGLSDADGQMLLMLWWAVNGPFFVRRVVTVLATEAARRSAGANSTPPSSPQDTTPAHSAAIPPGS